MHGQQNIKILVFRYDTQAKHIYLQRKHAVSETEQSIQFK